MEQYEGLQGSLPDAASVRSAIDLAKAAISRQVLDEKLTSVVRTLAQYSEWTLLNGPEFSRGPKENSSEETSKDERLPDLSMIVKWTPERFFRWFDNSIKEVPRNELVGLVKAWFAAQEGKHQFLEFAPDEALDAKRRLAHSVNKTIEALGITLICGKEDCGRSAALLALRSGSSVRGQYYFGGHIGERLGSSAQHKRSYDFPKLNFQ